MKFFMAVALLLTQISCKETTHEKISIQNDGTEIAYEDTRAGDTCLLFIHGWNIDKGYWENQLPFFEKKYRVVTIDLPGYGKSGKNRKNWSVENYGRDITAVMKSLDLKNVILIGHSMSGAIIVETALTNPASVIGIVGIDNFTNVGTEMTPELKKEIAAAYKAIRADYRRVVSDWVNQSLVAPSTDSLIRKRIMDDFMNVDTAVAVDILEQSDNYPLDQKLKATGKTLYLVKSNYRPTDTSGFKKLNIPYDLSYVGPTGHYPMIESPAAFNTALQNVAWKINNKKEK